MAPRVVVGIARVARHFLARVGLVPALGDGHVSLMRLSRRYRKGACLCSYCLKQERKAVTARAIAASSDNSNTATQQYDPIASLRARIDQRNAMRAWRKLGETY
jgi:hypothetical protein